MALLNRALNKAYLPPSAANVSRPASEREPAGQVELRGWLPQVRIPRRKGRGAESRDMGTAEEVVPPPADAESLLSAAECDAGSDLFDAVYPEGADAESAGRAVEQETGVDVLLPPRVELLEPVSSEGAGCVSFAAALETAREGTDKDAARDAAGDRPRVTVRDVAVGPWAWPSVCQELGNRPDAGFLPLALQLCGQAAGWPHRTVALTGMERGVGRTSTLLTLARVLMEQSEYRLAVLDADLEHRSVWDGLRSDAAGGLQLRVHCEEAASDESGDEPVPASEACRGADAAGEEALGVSSAQVVVEQRGVTPGRLSLISAAAVEPGKGSDADEQWCAVMEQISAADRDRDLVLIDAGRWEVLRERLLDAGDRSGIDALICVQRYDAAGESGLDDLAAVCGALGIEFLGVIETFVPSRAKEA